MIESTIKTLVEIQGENALADTAEAVVDLSLYDLSHVLDELFTRQHIKAANALIKMGYGEYREGLENLHGEEAVQHLRKAFEISMLGDFIRIAYLPHERVYG